MSVTITRLGHLGDGIADGPIYAARTLPGEVVEGTLDGDRITEPRIVTPSPMRVRPPCPEYNRCGGCALQHASDTFVAGWKQGVVETALAAQDMRADFWPLVTSAPRTRRRATFAARRTKKGAMVGFHGPKSDTIVPIRDCFLVLPEFLDLLGVLEEITRIGASRSATLGFALTHSQAGIDCVVTGGKPLDESLRLGLPKYGAHFARLTWEDEIVFTMEEPSRRFGKARVTPPPGAFLQATDDAETALQAAVAEATEGAREIVDLFSGCGTFTFPLAEHAAIHAVEGDAEMIAALDQGQRMASGLKRITTETRDLFRRPLEQDELARFEAVVIDPPRAGAEAQSHAIAKAQVPRVAMVSCNPVSFARDARILCDAGYRIDWVQVVDQFRWSPHVELVAQLSVTHIQPRDKTRAQ